MTYRISAVDRAIGLLEVLAEEPGLGITELAERTGNTKSLVFRLLHTLEQRGYVHKDPQTRTFGLGYRTLFLADHTHRQSRLLGVADPFLDRLAEAARENVLLSVREGLASVCVAHREAPQPLRLYAQVGRSVPLHVGGGPKVLLAHAPAEVQRAVLTGALARYTAQSITDPETLARTLAEIRRTGSTVSIGELDADIFSIAAPVRNHSGEVVAALSIAGPVSRLNPKRRERYRALAIETAGDLSGALGHASPTVAAVG